MLPTSHNEPPPSEWDTKPIRSYESLMQQEAHAAFQRIHDSIGILAPGTSLAFARKPQFWYDLLKILEYAVLK